MSESQQISLACAAFAANFEGMLKEFTKLLSQNSLPFHSGIYFQFIFMYAGFHLVSIFEADQQILIHFVEETKKQKTLTLELITIMRLQDFSTQKEKIRELVNQEGILLSQAVSFASYVNEHISQSTETPSSDAYEERFLIEFPIQIELKKIMETCLNQTWKTFVKSLNSIELSKSLLLAEITQAILLSGLIVAGNEQAMDDYIQAITFFLIRYVENVMPEKMRVH